MTANTPTRLVLKTTQDAVEAVPLLLGFHPHNSFVMIAVIEGGSVFGARIDLPEDPADYADMMAAIVQPAVRNDAAKVVLFVYDEQPAWPPLLDISEGAFEAAGLPVADVIHVHGGAADSKRRPFETVNLDQPGPIAAQGAYDGVISSRSREEHASQVASTVDPAIFLPTTLITPEDAREFAERIAERIGGEHLTQDEVIRLAAAVHDTVARDTLVNRVATTAKVPGGVQWWSAIARLTPACPDTAHLFGLIALGLYMSGEGALAWSVIDRAPVRTHLVNVAAEVIRLSLAPATVAQIMADAERPDAEHGGESASAGGGQN